MNHFSRQPTTDDRFLAGEALLESLGLDLPAAAWIARRLRRRGFSVPAGILTDITSIANDALDKIPV